MSPSDAMSADARLADVLPADAWPDKARRLALWAQIAQALAAAQDEVQQGAVAPAVDDQELRRALSSFTFAQPMALDAAAARVIDLLKTGNVHMMHPGYFGLFNPSTFFPGIIADQITASFNPQLAVWSHAPAAAEIERHTIAAIAGLLGWTEPTSDGHFTSGGAEANTTALLMALTRAFPSYVARGLRALSGEPRLYVSAESHLAWLKIAHQSGLGRNAVCFVPTDGSGRMDPRALSQAIATDRAAGALPFFVAATAGTTNAGMIDPLLSCGEIARTAALWFHVDAAWGGGALLCPRSAQHLEGIAAADSVTMDAHKWFAVPMAAGMILCRDSAILGETFRVAASYMPPSALGGADPYTHSLQWSRRFIGLKLFLSLAVLGWSGYRAHVARSLDLAGRLRALLKAEGWQVVNDSPLAVICFVDKQHGQDPAELAQRVLRSGRSWISAAVFEGRAVLRCCITSHFTTEPDLITLVAALRAARRMKQSADAAQKR